MVGPLTVGHDLPPGSAGHSQEILRPTDHTDTSALSKVRVAWVPPGESQLQGDYSMDSIDLGLRRDGIESWWAIA